MERVDLLILETHPVQYHAPVYAELARLRPGRIHVAYATDYSTGRHHDADFGQSISWDMALLEGYPHTLLRAERRPGQLGFSALHGRGIPALLRRLRPRAVLLTQLKCEFEWAAYFLCLLRGIPLWLRTETQDEASARSRGKGLLRGFFYALAYAPFRRLLPIGRLNREHYRRHLVSAARLTWCRYCVPDPIGAMTDAERRERRERLRRRLGIGPDECVAGFFGKLIEKKDPGLLIRAWRELPAPLRQRARILFVGAGQLRGELEAAAAAAGCDALFAGFQSQSEIGDYYLATDILVLPSRRMGETWGLVVNEGLQAGCGVIISSAVGCGADFGGWNRVRVIGVGEAAAAARAWTELAPLPRDFGWARPQLAPYSIAAAAEGIASALPLPA